MHAKNLTLRGPTQFIRRSLNFILAVSCRFRDVPFKAGNTALAADKSSALRVALVMSSTHGCSSSSGLSSEISSKQVLLSASWLLSSCSLRSWLLCSVVSSTGARSGLWDSMSAVRLRHAQLRDLYLFCLSVCLIILIIRRYVVWSFVFISSVCRSQFRNVRWTFLSGKGDCQTPRGPSDQLYNTLSAYCIPKVVRMETGEIKNEKVFESPRMPPNISLRHGWMKELNSEVAPQAKSSQPTQPIPNPNHERTGRPVGTERTSRSSAQEIDTRFSRDCKNTHLFVERLDKDKDTDTNVDADHDRTGRPVVIGQPTGSSTQSNEVDIDFRVSGLPHAVVKQAGNSRVRELVKKIENHPHRQDLQVDLQQSNAYNPFGETSKKIIRDMGNVELFELCETIPKVQCKECLLYWNQGIFHCTCGHLLRENQSSRGILRWTLDLLSIPNHVMKKGRRHGHHYGKTKEQNDHYIAHNLRRRCKKRGF